MTSRLIVSLSLSAASLTLSAADPKGLLDGLIFHAPFDGEADAKLATGDNRIYTAPPSRDPTQSTQGIDPNVVSISVGKGRYGDALHFKKKSRNMVFYYAEKNIGYREKDWSGTVSMWLSIEPADLKQQYADPIQITDKKYNNAALWVDFTKDHTPPHFRLGAFPDQNVWNPNGLKQNDFADSDLPIVGVKQPPFGRDEWTHVVITFTGFNSDDKIGTAKLYLNGEVQGTVKALQVYTWDQQKATIRVGLGYVGLFDELAIFDRSLSAEEIQTLYRLPHGLGALSASR